MARRERKQGAPIPRFYPVTKEAVDRTTVDPTSPRKQKTRHSDKPPVELSVGWLLHPKNKLPVATRCALWCRRTHSRVCFSGDAGPAKTTNSTQQQQPPPAQTTTAVSQQQHPSYTLLQENGFCTQVRARADNT
jgi:la-related protein 1